MSRFIDDTRPYTEEEKAWLRTRSGGLDRIRVNERSFEHLSREEKDKLQKRHDEDEEKEAKLYEEMVKAQQEAEEDSYHPDDVEDATSLTISQLRSRLEQEGLRSNVTAKDKQDPADPSHSLSEKEVLVYRLLDRLDEKRNAAIVKD